MSQKLGFLPEFSLTTLFPLLSDNSLIIGAASLWLSTLLKLFEGMLSINIATIHIQSYVVDFVIPNLHRKS